MMLRPLRNKWTSLNLGRFLKHSTRFIRQDCWEQLGQDLYCEFSDEDFWSNELTLSFERPLEQSVEELFWRP